MTMPDEEPLPDWERDLLEEQGYAQLAADQERMVRRRRMGPMPADFEPLAVYNAECARGLVHTAEYAAAMADLQRRFNEWAGL